MHVTPNLILNQGYTINDLNFNSTILGTIDGSGDQNHTHFSRLSSYFYKENMLPGYEPNSSNCLNPLANFDKDDEIDPQLQIPKLEKWTSAPSVFFKNNIKEAYSLRSNSVSLLRISSLPLDIYNVLEAYSINNGPSDFFDTESAYWTFIKNIVSDPRIETNKNIILENSKFQIQEQLTPPTNFTDPYIVFGKIDILAEAYDHLNTNPLNHGNTVNAVGYWIENVSGGGSNVIGDGQKPYILYKIDNDWMKDISEYVEIPNIFIDKIYDKDNMDIQPNKLRKNTHYIVTNTKGTTGKADNIDEKQYWDTKAHIENPVPNGFNPGFKQATINKNAKFKDGEYRVHIWMEDQLYQKYLETGREDLKSHGVDDNSTVIVLDNYVPYVEKVEMFSGTTQIYNQYWELDASAQKLEFKGSCIGSTATGAENVTIIVYTSEPMSNLSVRIDELNIDVQATKYNGTDNSKWQAVIDKGPIAIYHNANLSSKVSFLPIKIDGKDLNGNSIQGFKNTDVVIPVTSLKTRTSSTEWTNPNIAFTPDTKHYLKIGNTLKSWNGCLYADFSADRTNIAKDEKVTFTNNSYGLFTQWNWTFEGGNPSASTDESPVVQYPNAGTYKVSLTISDGLENLAETKEAYIAVTSIASTAEIDFIYKKETNELIGKSSAPNIYSWQWSFNNGTESGQVIVHTFPMIEVYNIVTLTVSFTDGSTKSLTQRIFPSGYPFHD
jgi:PKD repeat protein